MFFSFHQHAFNLCYPMPCCYPLLLIIVPVSVVVASVTPKHNIVLSSDLSKTLITPMLNYPINTCSVRKLPGLSISLWEFIWGI